MWYVNIDGVAYLVHDIVFLHSVNELYKYFAINIVFLGCI